MPLSTSGMLLLTACTEGRTFNLFRILPHPSLSSETCVQHLHVLRRGETTSIVGDNSNHLLLTNHTCPDTCQPQSPPPQVQDIAFSCDSRWAAISTLRGTTHVFPITPYGGKATPAAGACHLPPTYPLPPFHLSTRSCYQEDSPLQSCSQ